MKSVYLVLFRHRNDKFNSWIFSTEAKAKAFVAERKAARKKITGYTNTSAWTIKKVTVQ